MKRKESSYVSKNRALLKIYLKNNMIPKEVVTPPQMTHKYQEKYLIKLGFTIIKSIGNNFKVKFPKGWGYLPYTDEWTYVIDNLKRKRFVIYFKSYPNNLPINTHVNYMPRYRVKIDHEIPFDVFGKKKVTNEHYNSKLIGQVVDSNDNVLYEYPTKFDMVIDYGNVKKRAMYFKQKDMAREKLYKVCTKWLIKNYPDYDSIDNYWDEEKNES